MARLYGYGKDYSASELGKWEDTDSGLFVDHYPLKGVWLLGFKETRHSHMTMSQARTVWIRIVEPVPQMVDTKEEATFFENKDKALDALRIFRLHYGDQIVTRLKALPVEEKPFGTFHDNEKYRQRVIDEYVTRQANKPKPFYENYQEPIWCAIGVAMGIIVGWILFYPK